MFHHLLTNLDQFSIDKLKNTLYSQGYICIHNFIPLETVDMLLKELNNLKTNININDNYTIYRDDDGSILMMNRLERESDLLFDMARDKTIISLAEKLLDKPVIPLHVGYSEKSSLNSSQSQAHQDHAIYQEHFDSEKALAFWVALDDVTYDNAPIEFGVPSPLTLIPHVPCPQSYFLYELEDVQELTFIPCLIPKGGCVVFHSYAVYRYGENYTSNSRRAVIFNYRSSTYRATLNLQENR